MIHPIYRPSLLLFLALGAAPLLAQPTPTPQAGAPTEQSGPNTEAAGSKKTAPIAKESTVEPAPPASANKSPFDYRSSEEISEDLSVSFPVDI